MPSSEDVVDLDNPLPSAGAELPCVAALEFLADIYEQEGSEGTAKAVEVKFNVGFRVRFRSLRNASRRSGKHLATRRI